jgi:hypothetical protein
MNTPFKLAVLCSFLAFGTAAQADQTVLIGMSGPLTGGQSMHSIW